MDKKVIQKINSGDKSAYKKVFEEYFNALCAFSYKYINDQPETQDIVQEVFLALWEQKKEFDHINSIKSFLYASVRNKCLNLLKHKVVKQKHEMALIYELESEQFFTNHIIEEEAFKQLYVEIKDLPESAQNIMLLALKGLKNREIAEKLNITENTVKTHKKIAYAKLKKKLKPVLNGLILGLF